MGSAVGTVLCHWFLLPEWRAAWGGAVLPDWAGGRSYINSAAHAVLDYWPGLFTRPGGQ